MEGGEVPPVHSIDAGVVLDEQRGDIQVLEGQNSKMQMRHRPASKRSGSHPTEGLLKLVMKCTVRGDRPKTCCLHVHSVAILQGNSSDQLRNPLYQTLVD